MTDRVGRRGGKLINWRSSWVGLALHPVARRGLPAPCGLRVSLGPSKGEHTRQSPQGHGSRSIPSIVLLGGVNAADTQRPRAEHGLTTGCFAVVDNTLRGLTKGQRVVHNQARWTYMDAPSLQGSVTRLANRRRLQTYIRPSAARSASALMECAGWLLNNSASSKLEVHARFDQPRSYLSCHQQSIAMQPVERISRVLRSTCYRVMPAGQACARARTPCPKTTAPKPAGRSCWPSRRRRCCDACD